MSDGHCRHCADECGRWPWNNMNRDHFEKGEAATWDRDCCPACAEAERIEAALLDEYDEHEDVAVLAALRIVRCER